MNNFSLSNPSGSFMNRCTPIMNQWEAGRLSFEDTVHQFDMLRREAIDSHHYANQAQIEIMIGVMRGLRAELDIAIQQFRAARVLFEQAGNKERVLLCDTKIAEIYQQRGNLGRARQTYSAAYLEARRIGSIQVQASCLANIGRIAVLQQAMSQARPALEDAEKLALMVPERSRVLGLLCEIYREQVTVYLAQRQTALAWNAGKKALRAAQENQELVNLGRANRIIGELLTALGQPPSTREAGFWSDPDAYFQAAINYFSEIKADLDIAQTLCTHAESLGRRGQVDMAVRKTRQAAHIYERLGLMNEVAKASELENRVLTAQSQS